MFEQQPTLALLYEQLGLDSSEVAIQAFIQSHQLAADVMLHQAQFWTDSQCQFLQSHWEKDDQWSLVIDELNQALHNNT